MKLNSTLKRITFIAIFLSVFTSYSQEKKPSVAVMAYYVPSNNYPLENIPFEKLTHIIFSFTEVIDNKMQFKNDSFSKKLKEFQSDFNFNNYNYIKELNKIILIENIENYLDLKKHKRLKRI